jgi:hypothetical protein
MAVRNTSKTQWNMTCFEMLLDVQALKILQCIPNKVIEKLGMHNFVARPEALILMCLPVPPSCTRVKAQDTPSVVTKVLMGYVCVWFYEPVSWVQLQSWRDQLLVMLLETVQLPTRYSLDTSISYFHFHKYFHIYIF